MGVPTGGKKGHEKEYVSNRPDSNSVMYTSQGRIAGTEGAREELLKAHLRIKQHDRHGGRGWRSYIKA